MEKKKNIVKTVMGFMNRATLDHVPAYAASSAYFILLSFIPFILLLMTIARYTFLTQDVIVEAILQVVPEEFNTFVRELILEFYTTNLAMVPISAVVTLWTAGKGLQGLSDGLNTVYQVKDNRNFVVARIRSIGYTLLVILIIIGSLVLLVFGNSIQSALSVYLPFASTFTAAVFQMSAGISLLVLSGVFLLLYKFLPNRYATFRSQIPGAVISAVAWTIFSFIFSLYLKYFDASDMYGSLTTIIMIMLWLYFCMFIFLLGAEVNAYFENQLKTLQKTAVDRLRAELQSFGEQDED